MERRQQQRSDVLGACRAKLGFKLRVASPKELSAREDLREWVRAEKAAVEFLDDPHEAVDGADCVVSDAWVSMGDEDGTKRHNLLAAYQVNARLMSRAKKDASSCTVFRRTAARK